VRKIPTLFERDWEGDRSRVLPTADPECQWVLDGEGVPTRKWDGTACLVKDGRLFKRFDAKHGKVPPSDFMPAQPEPDPESGHWPGWVPVADKPADAAFREAWDGRDLADGTYELLGPTVNGNPELLGRHVLFRHGAWMLPDIRPRTYVTLLAFLATAHIEGVVWHHPDGRMAKLKTRDLGLRR
jgi:hypothetical protein